MCRLREAGLCFNPEKTQLFKTAVNFLGHSVSQAGIVPLQTNVVKIHNFPRPTDKKMLQRFLGLINFYRSFMPGLASTVAPLTDLTSPKTKFIWSEQCERAFQKARSALDSVTKLSFYEDGQPLRLLCDASDVGIGAVLEQRHGQKWVPLEFFSKKLSPTERRYSTFDRELLSVYLAVRHFRWMLTSAVFTIFTDHKPLIHAIHKDGEPWSPRQARHLSYISEFSTDLQHLPGKDNPVADALSRDLLPAEEIINAVAVAASIPPARFAVEQASCSAVARMLASPSLRVVDRRLPGDQVLKVDISTGQPRILVPDSLRQEVIEQVHGLHHPGARATRRLLSRSFVWKGMAKEANHFVRSCHRCNTSKVTSHLRPPPGEIDMPSRRFSTVHADLVGPLPMSRGARYLLTCIDRHSRWIEACPLENIEAQTVTDAFIRTWVTRFGVPAVVITDRGLQFTCRMFTTALELLGTELRHTTAYNPQCNGMVERIHRTLKSSLTARGGEWMDELPWTLLGLRNAPREDDNASPAEAVFGSPCVLPGSLLDSPEMSEGELRKAFSNLKSGFPVRTPTAPPPLKPVPPLDLVYVRVDAVQPPLSPKYRGPYKVIKQTRNTVRIRLGDSEENVNISRIKPYLGDPPKELPMPPRRGRPRKQGSPVAALLEVRRLTSGTRLSS